MSAPAMPAVTIDLRARARRGLSIYLAVVVMVSGLFEGKLLSTGDPIEKHIGLVLGLMWAPALASVIARVLLREGVGDVSFRFGGRAGMKMALLAWVFPMIVGAVAYGTAWATGLEHFQVPTTGATAHIPWPGWALLLRSLALNATLGTVVGAISAAGEEIGWRGYMLTRLIDAGVPRPILASGVVWALWHVPLIVSGQYAAGRYPWLSALLFVPSVIAAAYVAARVRLASGSVWPAVVFHAAWNAMIQGSFDRFTAGGNASRGTTLWTGESGILVVVVSVLVTAAITRRAWSWRRSPREEPAGELGATTA